MTESPNPQPAGWSARLSGNSSDRAVTDGLGQAFRAVLEKLGAGLVNHYFDNSHTGWRLEASGRSDAPEDHAAVLSDLTHIASNPAAETGSSEFTSPFTSVTNFHTAQRAAPATGGEGADAGAAAADPAPGAEPDGTAPVE